MPEYQVGDIRIKGGVVRKSDSTYKAFLDFPISLEWTETLNTTTVKWYFTNEPDYNPLEINSAFELQASNLDRPGGEPNTDALIDPGRKEILFTFELNDLQLDQLFDNEKKGSFRIWAVPGEEDSRGLVWLNTNSQYVDINFLPTYDSTDPANEDFNAAHRAIGSPFVAQILSVDNNLINIDRSWEEYTTQLGLTPLSPDIPSNTFESWQIVHKYQDTRDLLTYAHLGDDRIALVTNTQEDKNIFDSYPYGTLLKLYEPLPDDIDESSTVYLVKEILPQKTEVVDLIPYDQEDEDLLILRNPDSANVDSPISKRSTDLKSFTDLVTTDKKLKQNIINKYISGSLKPVELNIDYSNYENFINFSSAEKRLKNFKYKIQLIENYTAESSSFAALASGSVDAIKFENQIEDIKNNFDG